MRKLRYGMVLVVAVMCAMTASAYTKPLDNPSDVMYPISLMTGEDAGGEKLIEDSSFLKYLKNAIFVSGDYVGYPFDLNQDGVLSEDECDKVRVISVTNRDDIQSLNGIEAFPKLRELYCAKSGISKLDISRLSRLQELHCGQTAIRELDLTGCQGLQVLFASECHLTSLDTSKNMKLVELACMYQNLKGFEILENGWYQVRLKDWSRNLDLTRVSNVRIDGGQFDGINSRYNEETGVIQCSDIMNQISYDYSLGTEDKVAMDSCMHITMSLQVGQYELYQTNSGEQLLPQYFPLNTADYAPDTPQRKGYVFEGWYQSPECFESDRWNFGEVLQKPITLYAAWSKKKYTVIYNPNGGQMLNLKRQNFEWDKGDILPRDSAQPIRLGYQLSGWQCGKTILNTEKQYDYGEVARNDRKKELELVAIWKMKSGYGLRLKLNLPEGLIQGVKNVPSDETDISWDECSLLPTDEPELAGYIFDGWFLDAACSVRVTDEMTYQDIHMSQYNNDNLTDKGMIYGHFIEKHYTIQYVTGCKTKIGPKINIRWNDLIYPPKKKMVKKGYRFAGWQLINGSRVTTVRRLCEIAGESQSQGDCLIMKAMWYKKYEKKGTVFTKYGQKYKVIQSNRRGNKVKALRRSKKAPKRVFYNGILFRVVKK